MIPGSRDGLLKELLHSLPGGSCTRDEGESERA